MRILSDLVGTLQSTFRLGAARIKVAAGALVARNAADTADYPVAASAIQHLASDGKKVVFQAKTGMSADLTLNLPTADGSSGQAIVTDANGNLAFATVATGADAVKEVEKTVAYNSSSPVTVVTPPAYGRIVIVKVDVETAFNGTAPTMSVGVAGATSRYMGTTDIDLKTAGIYEVDAAYEEDDTPDAIIITFNADSSSQGSARVTVQYVNSTL